MAPTASTMLELGTTLPSFRLLDLDGKGISSDEFAGRRGILVAFICPHCPFVRHVRHQFARLAKDFQERGVAVLAINSNDASAFPEDSLEGMRKEAHEAGYSFPYLYDETQEVAKAFRAACTPDFYLFDTRPQLVYRGQLDDSRPNGSVPVTGKDLAAAVQAMLEGKPFSPEQRPSIGCNIKWKAGAEPEYFRV